MISRLGPWLFLKLCQKLALVVFTDKVPPISFVNCSTMHSTKRLENQKQDSDVKADIRQRDQKKKL